MTPPLCRVCRQPLKYTFVDLGMSPLANDYLTADETTRAERFYPLHAYVCEECLLVQVEEYESPDRIFGDYAYFSSYSDYWLQHIKAYTDMMTERFGLDEKTEVIEIASNDGYLLQYFKKRGMPVLGVEPAANVAQVAEEKGIPTITKFFGVATAEELRSSNRQADLLIGNNVLPHVPDMHDVVGGMKIILKAEGIFTMEFGHLLQLMLKNEFDTIYHEHFSYLSFLLVEKLFAFHGLTIFDVEELPTHGGAIRIYGKHEGAMEPQLTGRVAELKRKEQQAGLDRLKTYLSFQKNVNKCKRDLLKFLVDATERGKSIVGYGAPAKGNTLLNYCGVGRDFLEYTVDISPYKQGLFLPGTHIPIFHPDKIKQTKPDYVLMLPWNLKSEIVDQMSCIREWGGKFVTPVPSVEVF
jgi:SAM-dependent methyltransferase